MTDDTALARAKFEAHWLKEYTAASLTRHHIFKDTYASSREQNHWETWLAAWSSRAPAQDAVIRCPNGHFVIGPLDFMRTETGWDICLNDEAVITDPANDALNVLADILKTAAPAPDERADADMAQGALAAIRDLLDSGGIPRGTFSDDQVRNLVVLYNERGREIERLTALIDADRDREGAR